MIYLPLASVSFLMQVPCSIARISCSEMASRFTAREINYIIIDIVIIIAAAADDTVLDELTMHGESSISQ